MVPLESIAVSLEPQLYLAPQLTSLGTLQYPQGFHLIARVEYLWLKAQIKILISTRQGIAADVGRNRPVCGLDRRAGGPGVEAGAAGVAQEQVQRNLRRDV